MPCLVSKSVASNQMPGVVLTLLAGMHKNQDFTVLRIQGVTHIHPQHAARSTDSHPLATLSLSSGLATVSLPRSQLPRWPKWLERDRAMLDPFLPLSGLLGKAPTHTPGQVPASHLSKASPSPPKASHLSPEGPRKTGGRGIVLSSAFSFANS